MQIRLLCFSFPFHLHMYNEKEVANKDAKGVGHQFMCDQICKVYITQPCPKYGLLAFWTEMYMYKKDLDAFLLLI